jgi:hypothetical protein
MPNMPKSKDTIGVVIRDPGKKIFDDIKKVKAAGGTLFMRSPTGRRYNIEACEIEFYQGGNTIWVHSPLGATVLRIQCTGRIDVREACENPVAHADIQVHGNIEVCVPTKMKRITRQRMLTPEEAAEDQKVRDQVAIEYPKKK